MKLSVRNKLLIGAVALSLVLVPTAVAHADSVTGDCGTSYVYLYNLGDGSGDVSVQAGAYSNHGPIAEVDWEVDSYNFDTGETNSTWGVDLPQDTHWHAEQSLWTDTGDVQLTLWGDAYLTDGEDCVILDPISLGKVT